MAVGIKCFEVESTKLWAWGWAEHREAVVRRQGSWDSQIAFRQDYWPLWVPGVNQKWIPNLLDKSVGPFKPYGGPEAIEPVPARSRLLNPAVSSAHLRGGRGGQEEVGPSQEQNPDGQIGWVAGTALAIPVLQKIICAMDQWRQLPFQMGDFVGLIFFFLMRL